MNIVVLWTAWNDYLEASLDALSETSETRVLLCEAASSARLALASPRFANIERCHLADGFEATQRRLEEFQPDLILVCGWHVAPYRKIARNWRGRAVRVLYMDNQWLGTARQRLGVLTSPISLWPCFDAAFVTGNRQAKFARKLGFSGLRLQEGGIVADTGKFDGTPGDTGFLFVGRLVLDKGVDVLAKAYLLYRTRRSDAWSLDVCGIGPEEQRFADLEGAKLHGFTQPSDLPAIMSNSACLVLPSRFEPFGVVVHEAVGMGLYVVASTAVGAGDLYVEDFVNGRIIQDGDVEALAAALSWIHDVPVDDRHVGVERSQRLSRRQTPSTWAAALLSFRRRFDLDRRTLLRARFTKGPAQSDT